MTNHLLPKTIALFTLLSAGVSAGCSDDSTSGPGKCKTPGALLAGQGEACAIPIGATPLDPVLITGPDDSLLVSAGPGPVVSRSRDQGLSFTPLPTGAATIAEGQWLHPWLHRDTVSGRIFFNYFQLGVGESECGGSTGTTVWYSDDEGAHWTRRAAGCGSHDWAKIITGPAATPAQQAALDKSGYPQMVYLCATGPTLIIGPDHMCFSSSDGGDTWQATAARAADKVDSPSLLMPIAFPQAGAVGSDGTIYKTHAAPEGLALKLSHDGGDSWQKRVINGAKLAGGYANFLSSNLALDAQDNLYVVWIDDRELLPYLSVSTDRGLTWSARLLLSPQEVAYGAYPNVAVFSPGHVAVAFYGSASAAGTGDGYISADGRKYNAYLSVSQNALEAAPTLVTARINDPAQPVVDSWSFNTSEYLGPPVLDADGAVWAVYVNRGNGLLGRLKPE